MGVSIGTSTINEITDGSQVLEVQNNICAVKRLATIATRNDGDETGVYRFNIKSEFNHSSGGMPATGEYEAPRDGIYMLYVWFMIENTTQNNRYYDVEKNGVLYSRVYGSNGGNIYREFATSVVVSLSAGDTLRCRAGNVRLYGTGAEYTRWNLIYLG